MYKVIADPKKILKQYLVSRLASEKGGMVTIKLKSLTLKYKLNRSAVFAIRSILDEWSSEALKSGAGRKLRAGSYQFNIEWLKKKLDELQR